MIISGGIFEANKVKNKVELFKKKIVETDFWRNKNLAQKILKEKNFYENILDEYSSFIDELNENEELLKLALEENNQEIITDCQKKINILLSKIKKLEVKCFLSDENDSSDTFLEIHAGAGGTESQDWAQMLRRMYSKWIEKKKM